jgi:hypothetical protein
MGPRTPLHLMRDCSWVPDEFPKLRKTPFLCSSDRTADHAGGGYNCIAWAAGRQDAWWWPTDDPAAYWPAELPREPINGETVANFIKAFQILGFITCEGPAFEPGVEKIAIFVGRLGTPTHAARSLPNGMWTSKLGVARTSSTTAWRTSKGTRMAKRLPS